MARLAPKNSVNRCLPSRVSDIEFGMLFEVISRSLEDITDIDSVAVSLERSHKSDARFSAERVVQTSRDSLVLQHFILGRAHPRCFVGHCCSPRF